MPGPRVVRPTGPCAPTGSVTLGGSDLRAPESATKRQPYVMPAAFSVARTRPGVNGASCMRVPVAS